MKVGIVGAGPAGALLAWRLAGGGASVTVFDPSHPREKPCGGGLTGKSLALLPPAPAGDPLPARWVGSCRFDDGPASVQIALSEPVAIAARAELDAWLLRRAREAGARHVSERVVAVEKGSLRAASATYPFDVKIGRASCRERV